MVGLQSTPGYLQKRNFLKETAIDKIIFMASTFVSLRRIGF
jgi:hypothetical protein